MFSLVLTPIEGNVLCCSCFQGCCLISILPEVIEGKARKLKSTFYSPAISEKKGVFSFQINKKNKTLFNGITSNTTS